MNSYRDFTDHELSALLKKGDTAAYTEIYGRYFSALYRQACRKLQQEEEAKDLVQELFTVLWHRRAEISQENLASYLYASVRNRVLDSFARKQVASRYVSAFQEYIDRVQESTADHLLRERDLSEMIEGEIQRLPARMREVFELSRKQNLSHKQIAAQLGISEQTVAKQITNALKTLRTRLGIFAFLIAILGS